MNKQVQQGRVLLEVPFSEKDEAKELGAWWDPDIKKWFVPPGRSTAAFTRWIKKEDSQPGELSSAQGDD